MDGVSQQAAVCSRPGSYKKLKNVLNSPYGDLGHSGAGKRTIGRIKEILGFLEAEFLWVTTRCFCPASGFGCTATSVLPLLPRSRAAQCINVELCQSHTAPQPLQAAKIPAFSPSTQMEKKPLMSSSFSGRSLATGATAEGTPHL